MLYTRYIPNTKYLKMLSIKKYRSKSQSETNINNTEKILAIKY